MKISYNAPAMRASNALNASDSKVSKSIQRLSSGLKVTVSKDNPSGYAIGRRMNTQITGLGTATQSSNNGISVIETADGALTEVHEMLQRMNELAVKGETGTLTTVDRMALDTEVRQLKEEITRIATDTQFNGQTLLDGTFDLRGYTNDHRAKVAYYSDEVIPKEYAISALTVEFDENGKIDKDATQANLSLSSDFPAGVKISDTTKDKITLTGPLDFEMILDVEPDPIVDANGEIIGHNPVQLAGTFIVSYSLIWDAVGQLDTAATMQSYNQMLEQAAKDGILGNMFPNIPEDARVTSITPQGGTFYTIRIADSNGNIVYSATMNAGAGQPGTSTPVTIGGWTKPLVINATGIGAMDTQTGANEGQQLAIRIPTISLKRMGLEDTRMRTDTESADANRAIKGAILYVSDVRSRLGAYQNRLEHTVNNLDVSTENMTASYSRIMDVDMAEEMTSYTTEQVISQAAVSMLAQANERPSQVLQLLQ